MRFFIILATLSLTPVTYAATGCILDMNGSWSLNPEKSLDPTKLNYEVLVFSNTVDEQSYLMNSKMDQMIEALLSGLFLATVKTTSHRTFLGALRQMQQ